MTTQISFRPFVKGQMFGARVSASPVRRRVEEALDHGGDVVIDFDGVKATQSFVDELIGVLILRKGPDVLKHLQFKSCSDDMRAIVKFVVSDRVEQYAQPH
jgi:STAS-like domain of unknown function (DUF4325)